MSEETEVPTWVDVALLEVSLRHAADDVEVCDRLVELARPIGAGDGGGAPAALRSTARTARRNLERAELLLARLAADDVARGEGDAIVPGGHRRHQRRVDRAMGRVDSMLAAHRRHLIAAARLAAGIAATRPPGDPAGGSLWDEAHEILRYDALDDDAEATFVVPDLRALEAWAAGVVAQVAGSCPAFAVICVEGRGNRYVQVGADPDDPTRVESVGERFLPPGEVLAGHERLELVRLGFSPPDDEHSPNWWVDGEPGSVAGTGRLLARTLVLVHGVASGSRLALSVGRWTSGPRPGNAAGEGGIDPDDDERDPAWLPPSPPSVEAIADVLADRLYGVDALLGLDHVEVEVRQSPTPLGAGARITGEGARLLVRLEAPTPGDVVHLGLLGWEHAGDATVERRWPTDDLALACWHSVASMVAVQGLDLRLPVSTTTTPVV